MNIMSGGKLNVRPHPGPLPQERENHSPAAGIAQSLCLSLVILPEESTTGVNSIGFRAMRTSQWLFPLPGGEGQGEGEHNN
jgi:hypothetical protein